jgi:HAD superfamily hydrolase (TIGR01509 family)
LVRRYTDEYRFCAGWPEPPSLLRGYCKADDVAHSKPDPETFLKAARLLEVPPAECLVFEDAPKGVEAAANAACRLLF